MGYTQELHGLGAKPAAAPAPHGVTVTTRRVSALDVENEWPPLTNYEIAHPAQCNALPCDATCWIGQWKTSIGTDDWPTAPGEYIATLESWTSFEGEHDARVNFEPAPKTEPAEPMKSTDPGTLHRWRVTHNPAGSPSYEHIGVLDTTDAAIEAIAEDAGDRATITYAREDPWQDGRRHAARLDLRSREGEGSFAYERIDERPTRDETVADLRYRLAAIGLLIAHVATSSPDATAALVASAVHEIARGARTPEDALTLLPPDWAKVLDGLTC